MKKRWPKNIPGTSEQWERALELLESGTEEFLCVALKITKALGDFDNIDHLKPIAETYYDADPTYTWWPLNSPHRLQFAKDVYKLLKKREKKAHEKTNP